MKQWSGINAVLYYAPTIFSKLGMSSTTTALLATGVVGIVMFIFTIPSVLWIDRIGRRPVLTIGAIGMATCHIIIAILVAKNKDQWPSQQGAGWAAVVMVWLFVIHCKSAVSRGWRLGKKHQLTSGNQSVTPGARVPGSSSPRSGLCPLVRTVLLSAPRATG